MKAKTEIKLLFLFLFALVLYGLSFVNFFPDKQSVVNPKTTESKLHKAEKEILKYSSELGSIALQSKDIHPVFNFHQRHEKNWREKGFYFLIFKNDSLLYWTNNRISFETISPNVIENYSIIKLRNGWYETFNKEYNGLRILSFILLKNDFSYQNRFLQNIFNPLLGLSSNTEFKTSPSEGTIDINAGTGEYLFSLSKISTNQSLNLRSSETINHLFLYLFLIVILYLLYFTGNVILSKGNSILKIIYPVFLIGIVLGMIILKIPNSLFELQLFSSQLYASSALLNSLGAFMLLSLTMFLSVSYYYRLNRSINRTDSFIVGIVLVLLTFIISIILNYLIYGLIINSSISYDVSNIFSLTIFSFIGLLSISMLLFTFFLVAQAAVDCFKPVGAKKYYWVITIVTSVFFLIYFFLNKLFLFTIFYPEVLLWNFVFLLTLYYLTNRESPLFEFSHFLPLIILLASLSGYLIFKCNKIKEQNNRIVMAQRLERERDFVAEYLFEDITTAVSNDRLLTGLMTNPFQNFEAIEKRVNDLYFTSYWNKFETSIYIFDSLATLYYNPTNDTVTLNLFRQLIDTRGAATSSLNLFFINEASGRTRYIAFLTVYFSSGNSAGTIVVDLETRLVQEQTGFPELLLSSSVMSSTDLVNYSYARYNNGFLIQQSGEYAYTLQHIRRGDPVDNYRFVNRENYNHLIYRAGPSSVIILTKKLETWLDYITVFSYMFALCSLLTLVYGFFHLIPFKFSFLNLTFKKRIQQSMTLLVVASLILVGTGTVIYIINRNNLQIRDDISNRLTSALISIENELVKNGRIKELTEELTIKLSQISGLMSADFHIYDANGTILYSTQPKLFEQGLVSRKIDPEAFVEISYFKSSRIVQNERIGDLKFLSAYAPLRNEYNETVGFLNLPYFAKESELRNEISAFLIALINVYLLLLVLAIIIAVLVANRLTVPLILIRQKLAQTKLGRSNEYIDWKRQDEIGQLVSEYNRMVDQLSESADLLARSERELAWREMAKQVAHEIKNPLTPMKLSVQHLERIWKDDIDDKEGRVKRLTQTLIQQIDTLSAIASEFSNFAKLPKPQLEDVNLGQLLEGITNLYGQEENIKTEFTADQEEITVIADKDQLLRIFNNILKNAVQSISSENAGIINVNLADFADHVLISIKDNGEGIDPERYNSIFQPNFTTKTGGTGLGLSMVKNIIKSMSGEIYFESELGTGTTFFIKLPKREVSPHS
ncbi:MAG: ATP-binding protein [Bacteroidia bacterium]